MKTAEIRDQRSEVRGSVVQWIGGPVAFTLIELLVVIAIIAILAGMIFPITGAVNVAKIRNRARAELTQIETAIESYKIKNGYYPPDNNGYYSTNQLYYELTGTTLNNGVYKTLDGSAQIDATQVSNVFRNVSGFVNCTRGAGGDEGQVATAFLNSLRPDQTADLDTGVKLLVGPVLWPPGGYQPVSSPPAKTPGINAWCYNSSHPTNNPNSYDLWIDVLIRGKTNRISNWNKQAVVVSNPYP